MSTWSTTTSQPCVTCKEETRFRFAASRDAVEVPLCEGCYERTFKRGDCWICGSKRDGSDKRYCRSCVRDLYADEREPARERERDSECLTDWERTPSIND